MFGDKIHDLFTKDIPQKIGGVGKAYVEYYKALTYEKLVIILSGLSILVILFLAVNLFFLFIAIGLALFLGKLMGSYALGFVILGVGYLLLGLLFYGMRRKWIINPIIRSLQTIIYSDDSFFENIVKVDKEEVVVVKEETVVKEEETDEA
jgi:membrane protein implicated in regulation of membrane protease activity